eukprot:g1824.t1
MNMTSSTTKPTLMYFAGPGRGEISRLALHAGGVSFEDKKLSFEEFGKVKFDSSKPGPGQKYGSLPIFLHGKLQLAQSQAIACYAGELGLTAKLNAAQRATDLMYLGVHADIQSAMYKCLFGTDESKAAGLKNLPEGTKKFLEAFERDLPTTGFVQGLSHPTLADLAIFDVCTSPFPGLPKLGVDISKYSKITALVASVKAFPALKTYLAARGF